MNLKKLLVLVSLLFSNLSIAFSSTYNNFYVIVDKKDHSGGIQKLLKTRLHNARNPNCIQDYLLSNQNQRLVSNGNKIILIRHGIHDRKEYSDYKFRFTYQNKLKQETEVSLDCPIR